MNFLGKIKDREIEDTFIRNNTATKQCGVDICVEPLIIADSAMITTDDEKHRWINAESAMIIDDCCKLKNRSCRLS